MIGVWCDLTSSAVPCLVEIIGLAAACTQRRSVWEVYLTTHASSGTSGGLAGRSVRHWVLNSLVVDDYKEVTTMINTREELGQVGRFLRYASYPLCFCHWTLHESTPLAHPRREEAMSPQVHSRKNHLLECFGLLCQTDNVFDLIAVCLILPGTYIFTDAMFPPFRLISSMNVNCTPRQLIV